MASHHQAQPHHRPGVGAADFMSTSSGPARVPDADPGPLVVSEANPRYFTVASDQRKAVYLTGSHIRNNLHDGLVIAAVCVALIALG